jgi:hypothetical protein
VQHPPTTQLSDLHQQSATRAVYDNPPAIESSRRLVLRALLRLRYRRVVRDLDDACRATVPRAVR